MNAHLVYNALSQEFIDKGTASTPVFDKDFTVLMLCSLKAYKGVNEFVALAQSLPQLRFELVINASLIEIDRFFKTTDFPSNLSLFPSQQNVHPFYQRANLVVNLSHPLKWVETFGLTALEAMCYGLPVVVPPVGGIAELVENDFNGFKIDVRDTEELSLKLSSLSASKADYLRLSHTARIKSQAFQPQSLAAQALEVILS